MCSIEVKKLSQTFIVRELTEDDIDLVYGLSLGNPLYFEYCPPRASKESILQDMKTLPPNKTEAEKWYVGYFEQNRLIAILDLIEKYPNEHTCYIGLFMVEVECQGKAVGSSIIRELKEYLKPKYEAIELGYVKGNPQCEAFWKKNDFKPTGVEVEQENFTIVCMRNGLV